MKELLKMLVREILLPAALTAVAQVATKKLAPKANTGAAQPAS
jgi:hypothetical protein